MNEPRTTAEAQAWLAIIIAAAVAALVVHVVWKLFVS